MCPMPTWPSSLVARSASASMSSAWGACYGRRRTNERASTSSFRCARSKSTKLVGGERALLPASLLRFSVAGERVVPHFISEADTRWLRALIDEARRFVGRRRRELEDRLREPLPGAADSGRQRLVAHVLGRSFFGERRPAPMARKMRAALFGAAARSTAPRHDILATVAASLGVTAEALEEALFSDLPGERAVGAPAQPISPLELALRANLALPPGLL